MILCLMGATATGKTDLAIRLAKQFPLEIISVDSAMIYRGMNIGSAKPDQAILRTAPHHLIDIIDPCESYSAAKFCQDSKTLIEAIIAKQKVPLFVGGTMLYFKALQQGLSPLPNADPIVREKIAQQAAELGWQAMHKQLQQVDPITAKRIHPNDPQRIQRALEVHAITGQPMSELIEQNQPPLQDYSFLNIGLDVQLRSNLHQRIKQRLEQMLNDGFIDEVKGLQQHYALDSNSPAMRCVGYRQVLEHLAGEYDQHTLCERAVFATRQLAKRQLTWLRSWPDLHRIDCEDPELFDKASQLIRTNCF